MPEHPKVAAIVGPTAVGKTELSLVVAETLCAEIVSVDSMQIYTGMDIGTAKPSEDEKRRVRHHLLDLRPPSHDLTVREFQSLARAAIDEISQRDRLPLLVGGSGLYFRAAIDDLNFPPRSTEIRAVLEATAEEVGPQALHARLQELDPPAAARIESGNVRRTIRALEVIEITGRRFSDNDSWERFESIYQTAIAGLERPREVLYERVAGRVDAMLEAGLVAEVERIGRDNFGVTAGQALGYRQVLERPPGADASEVRADIVTATKRFARRQESWFRSDPRVRWFDADDPSVAEGVVTYFRQALGLP